MSTPKITPNSTPIITSFSSPQITLMFQVLADFSLDLPGEISKS
jgi:hypothetical protein